MTTMAYDRLTDEEGMPSARRFLAYKIGKTLDRKDGKRARTRMQNFLRIVFQLAGFISLTTAGFTWHPIAGYVVAGLSCFALSWLTTGGQSESNNSGLTR